MSDGGAGASGFQLARRGERRVIAEHSRHWQIVGTSRAPEPDSGACAAVRRRYAVTPGEGVGLDMVFSHLQS